MIFHQRVRGIGILLIGGTQGMDHEVLAGRRPRDRQRQGLHSIIFRAFAKGFGVARSTAHVVAPNPPPPNRLAPDDAARSANLLSERTAALPCERR